MTAGVVKGTDARFAAQQQDVLVANGECPEFAECVQIIRAADAEPFAIPDVRHLPKVMGGIEIPAAGKRGLGPRQPHIGRQRIDGR